MGKDRRNSRKRRAAAARTLPAPPQQPPLPPAPQSLPLPPPTPKDPGRRMHERWDKIVVSGHVLLPMSFTLTSLGASDIFMSEALLGAGWLSATLSAFLNPFWGKPTRSAVYPRRLRKHAKALDPSLVGAPSKITICGVLQNAVCFRFPEYHKPSRIRFGRGFRDCDSKKQT